MTLTPRQEKLIRTLGYMKTAGDPIPDEAWKLIDSLASISANGWDVTPPTGKEEPILEDPPEPEAQQFDGTEDSIEAAQPEAE